MVFHRGRCLEVIKFNIITKNPKKADIIFFKTYTSEAHVVSSLEFHKLYDLGLYNDYVEQLGEVSPRCVISGD